MDSVSKKSGRAGGVGVEGPMTEFPLLYRWRKYRPEWYAKRCRLIARGKMNSAIVEFESGERAVVSRNALRKVTN